jgi:hypothetical protein
MKQNHIATITVCIMLIIFGTTAFVSCTKSRDLVINGTNIQPCKNVVCYNGGTCVDGACKCSAGFEGVDCNQKWNDRYQGTYIGSDDCNTSTNYTTTISTLVNRGDGILISNITKFAKNVNVEAYLNPDKTTFNIAPQRFDDSLYISGTGTQTESKDFINIWMLARDSFNHVSKNCSILLRKN